jgi:hypothetical protein
MPPAVIASVRAIAQAHTAFSRAAFGAVLFADGGIESQRWNRPNNETEQSNCRNELAHRCLPLIALSFVAPCAYFYPKWGHPQIQKGQLRGLRGIELTIKISGVKWTETAKVVRRGNAVVHDESRSSLPQHVVSADKKGSNQIRRRAAKGRVLKLGKGQTRPVAQGDGLSGAWQHRT